MAMSNFTCHHLDGFDDDPKNGKGYYLAKDGRFYTYEDLSRANKRYHDKKFELDKIRHGLTNTGNLQSAALTKKPKPPPPSTPPPSFNRVATAAVKVEKKVPPPPPPPPPPPRYSNRPRETPKTIYMEAMEEEEKKEACLLVRNEDKRMTQGLTKSHKGTANKITTSSDERTWNSYYRGLSAYQKANGTCNVSQKFDKSLARWVSKQRGLNASNQLAKQQKEKLNALGFDWMSLAEKRHQQWMENYNSLKKFQSDHGHTEVPASNKSLNKWASRQRVLCWQGKLYRKREDLLRAIKFRLEKLKNADGSDYCSESEEDNDEDGDEDDEEDEDEDDDKDDNDEVQDKGIQTKIKAPKNASPKIRNDRDVNTIVASASSTNDKLNNGAMSDDETAEDPSTKVNLFGTLMPLIVELKDLVEKPCLLECSNFLLRVLQGEKQSISNTSNGSTCPLLIVMLEVTYSIWHLSSKMSFPTPPSQERPLIVV